LLLQSHRPAQTNFVADLDRTGIAQSLLDESFGHFRRLSHNLKVNRFDDGIGAFPLVALSETGDGSTHRRHCAGFVVAMLSTEASRCDQKCARSGDLLEQRAHHGMEKLDAHP